MINDNGLSFRKISLSKKNCKFNFQKFFLKQNKLRLLFHEGGYGNNVFFITFHNFNLFLCSEI